MKCIVLFFALFIVACSAFPRISNLIPGAPIHQDSAPRYQMRPSLMQSTSMRPTSMRHSSMDPSSIRSLFSQKFGVTPIVKPQLLLNPNRKSVSREETPYLKWYLPTFKCDANWYCRAELSAYKEFSGKITVAVGYSTWYFNEQSAAIPYSTLDNIANTVFPEIVSYTDQLSDKLYNTPQSWLEICPTSLVEVDNAFQEVIKTFVDECKYTTDFVCEKSKTVPCL